MGTKPVLSLLVSMSVPPMISMLIQSLYNIVDSLFVARLSQDALTAVSLVFPLQNLVLAVAVGTGVGVNACVAKSLGEKNRKEVDLAATQGAISTIFHIILFIFIGAFGSRWFLGLFTDMDSIIQMGCEYSYIVICFSGASMFHILIEKIFQSTGNMVVPMILQAVGAIVNIILDPILIFGLIGFPALGIAGAAIATVIGQFVACFLAVILYLRKDCGVHINIKKFKWNAAMAKKIYSIAIPSGLMISMPSILVGVLNRILFEISQTAVAVFGIYFKLQTFVYMPANGVIQGMRPIISYNFGARNYKRMKQTLRSALSIVGAIMFAGMLLFLFQSKQILILFGGEAEMMEIGINALRIISLGFVVSTIGVVISGAFEALGKGVYSLTVSLLRQMLIIPPLAFLLVRFTQIGINGVWMTFPIAETIASVVALILYGKFQHTQKE